MNNQHQPVLLDPVLRQLSPHEGQSYFDGTAGYGGHAAAVIARIGQKGRVILADRDHHAIAALGERFGDRAEIMRANYLDASKQLIAGGTTVDLILLDLGVSSPQLENLERGFSFNSPHRLDMRMDQSQGLTAWEVVNQYAEMSLADVIGKYGEERRAKTVARAIVAARPIDSAQQLALVVRKATTAKGIDPATRTFQAIRIEVNAELASLEAALPIMAQLLNLGGHIAVISFHSLEDRIVKTFFNEAARDCICPPRQPICTCQHVASLKILTKKAIKGSEFDKSNPRARSAKLRAAEKINQNKRRVT